MFIVAGSNPQVPKIQLPERQERALTPAALFPGHPPGVAFWEFPRVEVRLPRPLSLFLALRGGHAREELRCSSSHPCVPGTRFLRYALTDLVPLGRTRERS